jgi:hypothetical protein
MSITTAAGYDDYYVSGCVLRDQAGNTVTVPLRLRAIAEVAAEAERVLAPRLVPGLIARFTAGRPVTIGRLTADRQGLSWCTGSGPPESSGAWEAPWPRIQGIEFTLEGQRATVKDQYAYGGHSLVLDGQPNSFLIRYLVAHAAASAGIPVTGHAVNWDGKSDWDPEAAFAAPALPAPGAVFPAQGNSRRARKRRFPHRTALALALVTGIAVGWALTFDHGGPITTPSTSNDGDHIASALHPCGTRPGRAALPPGSCS